MANKVSLPVTMPVYATYHTQGSGAPAAGNPSSYNWYLTHCLMLKCSRKFLRGYTSPEADICGSDFLDNPYLEKHRISFRFTWESAAKTIKRMLEEDFYVYFTGVDDFYVKGKSWYRERHFEHDGMICGYDDEKKTYDLFAYDQNWRYRVFTTPQSCFHRGLRARIRERCYGCLIAVKAVPGQVELDCEALLANLKDYLHSDLERYKPEEDGDVFGLVVHDYLGMYLDRIRTRQAPYERIDRRIFRLLWEHKKCMLDRIRAVEAKYGWTAELSQEYARIEQIAHFLLMLYARYLQRREDDLLLGSLAANLRDIKEAEASVLSRLAAAMEDEQKIEREGS